MPLLDHFRPPLDARAPWASVGTLWVSACVGHLNQSLPRNQFLALATTHLGHGAEADISEFALPSGLSFSDHNGHGGLTTLATPAAQATFVATFADAVTVEIHDTRDGGMRLVGVIEFVSPANKDRDNHRRQFIGKCVEYLRQGIGLVVVDVVTNRSANLHNELMATIHAPPTAQLPDGPIYVAGYRQAGPDHEPVVESWHHGLAIGAVIPAVPLALKNGPAVMVDLDGSYAEALAKHNL